MFVYRTYILEGEADAKFSLGDIWKLFQEDLLPNNTRNFWDMANDKLYGGMELPTKTDLPLNTEIIKQAHGLLIEDEEDVLMREYRKSPVFAGYHIFALAA